MINKLYLLVLLLCLATGVFAQEKGVYPTHWWVGMKSPKLQLMIHEPGAGNFTYSIAYPGVRLEKTHKVENPNYAFLDLNIQPTARPGKLTIKMTGGSGNRSLIYELKAKPAGNGTTWAKGVTQADMVYLLMPDRFANGDPSNDIVAGMRDGAANRNNPFDRHGGDLQGVINNLDYLKGLGVTALWMTPVVENDMARTDEGGASRSTYHGYAFTNHYQVDRRFGGNEKYKELGRELKRRGMKLVQDAVYNHVGRDHFFIRDMPSKDWVNQWPKYQNTSFKEQPLIDPYRSAADSAISVSGWFTPFMADLNQNNPLVANFLVQHAIWSTQEFELDGWRVDTYFYSDPKFLNRVNTELLREFPKLTVFGETWVQTVASSAYFTQNTMSLPFKHNVQGITDFPLYFAMLDGLNQPFGWAEGVNRVYGTLVQDIMYKDPTRNSIHLDNHDLDRFYSVVGDDFDKYKMGINWLLTLRGIPQLYYGTEILMKNFKNPSDAEVRRGFPGGWAGDMENKFEQGGRNSQEQAAYEFVSRLANFRKASPAITRGKLMQFVPEDGLYTYFRYSPEQTVMVISHTGKEDKTVAISRFAERINGFTKMRNVQTGEVRPLADFVLKPKESFVMELLK